MPLVAGVEGVASRRKGWEAIDNNIEKKYLPMEQRQNSPVWAAAD